MAEYNKWINAKEQKPEAYEDVLVLFEYYFCGGHTTKLKIGTAYYVKDGDKWLGDDLYALPDTNVIYWQPLPEPLDDGWLEKEVENIELNMSLEDAYRHIKSSYIHHMHERNAVFLPKAELIALICIKKAIAESKEDKK